MVTIEIAVIEIITDRVQRDTPAIQVEPGIGRSFVVSIGDMDVANKGRMLTQRLDIFSGNTDGQIVPPIGVPNLQRSRF